MNDHELFATEIKAIGQQLIEMLKRHGYAKPDVELLVADAEVSSNHSGEFRVIISLTPPDPSDDVRKRILEILKEFPDAEIFHGELKKPS